MYGPHLRVTTLISVTATALRRAAAGGDPDQEIPGVPPRDPDSRFPTESGNRVTARFPIPDSRPNRESAGPARDLWINWVDCR